MELFSFQTWALAFRQDPDLKNVEHFYQECKQQGLEFPPPDSENLIRTAVSPTVSSMFYSINSMLLNDSENDGTTFTTNTINGKLK
jgi:hypothetical protein